MAYLYRILLKRGQKRPGVSCDVTIPRGGLNTPIYSLLCRWIMEIKEQRKLPQVTVNKIIEDFSEFCENNITKLGEEVMEKIKSAGISSEIPGLAELFSSQSQYCQPFAGLDTTYRQLAFYRQHFKLVVRKHNIPTHHVYNSFYRNLSQLNWEKDMSGKAVDQKEN